MNFAENITRYRVELFLGCFLFGCAAGTFTQTFGIAPILLAGSVSGAFAVRKRVGACTLFLCVAAFSTGLLRADFSEKSIPHADIPQSTQKIHAEGVVTGEPSMRRYEQQIFLSLERVNGEEHQGVILVNTPLAPRVFEGERMEVRCRTMRVSDLESETFRAYLLRRHISTLCSNAEIISHDGNTGLLPDARKRIAHAISRAYPSPESDLLGGVLIGAQQGFSESLKKTFQASGLSHVVAVSGANITLMIFFLQTFLSAFGFSRRSQFLLLGVGVLVFTALCGASSSAVRASIMGLLTLVAEQLGRISAARRVIFVSASGMAFVQPSIITDSLSFQLSFLATLGLVYLAPLFSRALRWIPDRASLRTLLSQTLAAIFVTEPLILFHFGMLSLVAPLANVVLVPLVPLMMGFSALWGVFAFLEWAGSILVSAALPFSLQWLFAWPAWLSAHVFIQVASAAQSIPFAYVTIPFNMLSASIIGLSYGLAFASLLKSRVSKTVSTASYVPSWWH